MYIFRIQQIDRMAITHFPKSYLSTELFFAFLHNVFTK